MVDFGFSIVDRQTDDRPAGNAIENPKSKIENDGRSTMALENPIPSGAPRLPQPCVLVIFGGDGDLSWRKLLPAVYNLNVDGVLPSHFAVVCFGLPSTEEGRAAADPDTYIRARARDGIERFSRQPLEEDHWEDFARALFLVPGSFGDASAYEKLKTRLTAVETQFGVPGSRVYYLAVPPSLVATSVGHLKEAGLVSPPEERVAFTRVIVEKPIGRDLKSARLVLSNVGKAFAERQTYRIDHYLGKETVQNLLVLRFANSIFEPLWNGKHIDHVQITVAEEDGLAQYNHETGETTASRVGYYEGVGALRDMVQNHMLQVLCIAAMEPPYSLEPDVVRDVKASVLHCLRPMKPADVRENVVRGQYIEGFEHGHRVRGYRHEVRDYYEKFARRPIPPEAVNSTTETYVALRVFVDNWRWSGVPFYLRTGKRMPKRGSEVAIQFKAVPQVLFNANPGIPLEPCVLTLRVQPEEGLSMRLISKLPGPKLRLYPVKMEFSYISAFGKTSPEAYERLILDVMAEDATNFMRADAVEAAWKFVTPILETWEQDRTRDLPEYQCGTWGPIEADRLIERDGRHWRTL
jgi:glucose-6-phosphate 1-dehydrogenase